MMQRHFDEDLKQLNANLLKMAALAEESIYISIKALKDRDKELAQCVVVNDRRIDELEIELDELAISLLALRQPIAVDLRFITTGMKINGELERIADLSVNIAQRVLAIADMPNLKPVDNINKLADISRRMVREAIDSFVNRDEKLARQVIGEDPEADNLRDSVYKELIEEYMLKDNSTITRAVPLILVSRHLERICDHATYIAEEVIYMIRAKIVKHHPEELDK
ncbi:phosphate transport system regulatory protein PhoU [Candidatus Omnitrophus magneticus]|uniref:Phosphate-specific transport system accessory protein PhoU n=1 Tax=Candidatus Omnitrophus magneticus TaxID=1609969 RepID=A0A0F0CQN1_9BACT|nr:phosphate transport system regulatory protein PhoU [Candidatus Omnitrophus magneticus]